VLELAGWLNRSQVATSAVAEALRWLGLIRDPKTHAIRRWLLCDSLGASSVLVRDGAIVGLSYLNDPGTKNYLKLALSRESVFGAEAQRLFSWPTAAGTYLGRLALKHPDRVQDARTSDARNWLLRRAKPPAAEQALAA
jgi:hypothetical protein